MGQNNRARRAAKQRARRKAHPAGQGWSGFEPHDPHQLALAQLMHAVSHSTLGVPVKTCVDELLRIVPGRLDRAADDLTQRTVDSLFQAGWTPVDLHEIARRQLDAPAVGYLIDSIAAAAACYPAALLDPRWQAELSAVDATVWWGREHPHLGQWSARHARGRAETLAVVIDVLALLGRLPELASTLPAPGSAADPSVPPGVDARVLARVRALLAKAESTEFPDEAEALSAKAQQLMSRYSLRRAMIDHEAGRAQRARPRRIWLDAPYVGAKSLLVTAVARANRCQTVLCEGLGFVTVIGDAVDQRVVDLLATSLLVQATRAMVPHGSQTSRGGVSRTRSFRQSFLVAYAGRIGERLQEANDAAQAGDDRLLPVLAARRRAVDDAMHELYPHLVDRQVAVSNAAGWGAGRAAADLALFDVHGVLDAPRDRAG